MEEGDLRAIGPQHWTLWGRKREGSDSERGCTDSGRGAGGSPPRRGAAPT